MGYGIVPDIKDERIVCQQPCEHRDCAAMRAEWTDAKCAVCGNPMLPGQHFYYNDQKEHEHAGCAYDQAQKELDKMRNKREGGETWLVNSL